MIEIKDTCVKGTRILFGNEKRQLINALSDILIREHYTEISIPIMQFSELFAGKVGNENQNMMYHFTDSGARKLCLAPEYTAVIQKLAKSRFKHEKDFKIFYVAECFRGEKPQAGRYRQFTQLGVEIINPTKSHLETVISLAESLVRSFVVKYEVNKNAKRGLDYYKNGRGFEIICESLGSSKQVCGGGEYDGGVGFAIGIDRLLLA